jgi:hypothetical protein
MNAPLRFALAQVWPWGEGMIAAPRWLAVLLVLLAVLWGGWSLYKRLSPRK